MKKYLFVTTLLVMFLMVALAGCGAKEGQNPPGEGSNAAGTPAYKADDVIKVIVPFSAGGGYDRLARLIQPYFQDAINEAIGGGSVTVLVENITGAGGVLGYSEMFRAPGDGKTLGVIGTAASPYQQLSSGQFDLGKFVQLGQMNNDPDVLVVSAKSPFNNINDLVERSKQQPILFATEGQGASGHLDPLVTQSILKDNGINLNIDFLHYEGTSQALLGVVKGEAEAELVTESTALSLVKSGDLKGIAITSLERGKYVTDAPTMKEQNISGAEDISNAIGMTRILVSSPGTPDNVAKVLRDALKKAIENPDFLDKAKTASLPVFYASPEDVQKNMDIRLQVADKYKDLILPLMK
ncbi:tripartite tricarboxylate transporter substrate binding protein [Candidatus Formimonas warabiya]|uniref:Tripartite tricarboxylate transporter substrate binding protein n=1 Tax=Formimonas warabiya TaxID=1761012 RepID=A0A3G1KXN1_FORW1|nr:tripartite tricarboxylate transporter substrate binding protein [Candidatus Formimonas warabiya]ATW27216.1 hypothetical protein DCMF_22870 [Candidatus Formimonas warabiya]